MRLAIALAWLVLLAALLALIPAIATMPPKAEAGDTILYIVDLTQPAVEVPADFARDAGTVIACESNWRADAVNLTSGTRGLFQLHPVHKKRIERLGYTWADMLDARLNTIVALTIWREQGFRPWECRP